MSALTTSSRREVLGSKCSTSISVNPIELARPHLASSGGGGCTRLRRDYWNGTRIYQPRPHSTYSWALLSSQAYLSGDCSSRSAIEADWLGSLVVSSLISCQRSREATTTTTPRARNVKTAIFRIHGSASPSAANCLERLLPDLQNMPPQKGEAQICSFDGNTPCGVVVMDTWEDGAPFHP